MKMEKEGVTQATRILIIILFLKSPIHLQEEAVPVSIAASGANQHAAR